MAKKKDNPTDAELRRYARKLTEAEKQERFEQARAERRRQQILQERGLTGDEEGYPEEEQEQYEQGGQDQYYPGQEAREEDQRRREESRQQALNEIKRRAKEAMRKRLKQQAEKEAAEAGLRTGVAAAGEAAATGAAAGEAAAAGVAGTATGAVGGSAALPVIGTILAVILAIVLLIAFIILIFIIGCNADGFTGNATRATAKILSFVGVIPDNICEALSLEKGGGGGSGGFGGGGASRTFCTPSDNVRIANENGVPTSPTRSPELENLIDCITEQFLAQGFTAGQLGSVFTFENTNPSCNYNRGESDPSSDQYCGVCAHSQNSCHYGGRNGTNGAEAVDFGLGEVRNDALFNAITIAAESAACRPLVGYKEDEVTHYHISTTQCDADGGD